MSRTKANKGAVTWNTFSLRLLLRLHGGTLVHNHYNDRFSNKPSNWNKDSSSTPDLCPPSLCNEQWCNVSEVIMLKGQGHCWCWFSYNCWKKLKLNSCVVVVAGQWPPSSKQRIFHCPLLFSLETKKRAVSQLCGDVAIRTPPELPLSLSVQCN